MSTRDNLEEAFAGESQANRRYLAFAKKAEKEGYKQVAKLFRAAADAETVHALAHLDVLQGVGSTKENLKIAINGETAEYKEMYPAFIEQARAEGADEAKLSFIRANAVEKIHADLYQNTLDNLEASQDVDYYVCQVCGNTVENESPKNCPICGQPKEMFKLIDNN